MAENEELDPSNSLARWWETVINAALESAPIEKIESLTEKAFKSEMRKVLKQFDKCGVTTSDFVRNRESTCELAKLLIKVEHYPDAVLLVSVLCAYSDASPIECLIRWLKAILDKFFGVIGITLVGTDHFSTFDDTENYFGKVRKMLQPCLLKLATKLNSKPSYKPVYRSKNGEVKVDPTASQLHVSLIGKARE